MPTYYKYQNPSEIGAAPTLDWGTVIGNVNENLQKQEQQRYENRESDKTITNDILKKANEITASSDPNFGATLQKSAYDIKTNANNYWNLVKNGKASRSDFNIFMQNTSASVSQLDTFSKNYNKIYDAAVTLRKEGKTNEFANAMQDALGGYQNLTNKKVIHNMNDGFLYTADLDPETGKVREGAMSMVPMQTLNNIKLFTNGTVDLQDAANKYAKDIKPFIISERTGKVLTREEILKRPGYTEFLDNAFNGIAVDEDKIGAILTRYCGYKADVTNAKNSDTSKKILAGKLNGAGAIVPEITTAMRDEAKAAFEKQLLYQVKSEETAMPVFAPKEAKEGKPPKYTPVVGDISRLNYKGTTNLRGVALGVDGVIIDKGKGIQDRIDAVSYEGGRVKMNVTKISGTETGDITTGNGNVKVGEGKKNIKENTRTLNDKDNNASMSIYIKQVPYPGQDRNFRSLEEATRYLKSAYAREKGVGGGQGGEVKSEYTNVTETNKGTIGVKNGKWYDTKTGKPIQ